MNKYTNTIIFTEPNKPTVKIEVILKETKKGLTLSICGESKELRCWGQMYEELLEVYGHLPKVQEIVAIWKRWHLNDMRAGNKLQEESLRHVTFSSRLDWYDYACDYLRARGLYNNNDYVFGSGWCFEELPEEVINTIKSW